MKTIKLPSSFAGMHISTVAADACKVAKEMNCIAEFDFNEVVCQAAPSDTPEAVVERFMAENERRYQAYIASPEYKESCRLAEIRDREQKAALAQALTVAPSQMALADAEAWATVVEKNKDPYGGACVKFAETWARLMEGQMALGVRIADCADKMSNLADVEAGGITGFMYGCAVGILAKCWKHGEALRLWHNKTSQIGNEGDKANDEGGVLNPAVLRIG